MAFFSNKTVNYLNIQLALVNVLDQAYFMFIPLYLYANGFSVMAVFAFYALLNVLRIPLRFLTFPIIRRWGIKTALMIGAMGYACAIPLLHQVRGMDGWLLLYILLFSAFNAIHWLSFHTYYSLAGDPEKRGRQVAVAYALIAGFQVLAPLLSAFTIVHEGFREYFLFSFIVGALMLLTISRCEDIAIPPVHWREGRKLVRSIGVKVHLMEAAGAYPVTIGWLFAVYFYVDKILSLGGIIAFGVLMQVLYQLLLGSLVDKGKGTRIVNTAGILRIASTFARAFLPLSLPMILGTETLAAAGNVHHVATQPTVMYNAGKQSAHPIWYWLFAEMAWDIGTLVGAGSAALLLWQGVELRHVILLSLPFMAVLWWLLHGFFAKHSYVPPAL